MVADDKSQYHILGNYTLYEKRGSQFGVGERGSPQLLTFSDLFAQPELLRQLDWEMVLNTKCTR